MTFGDRRSGIFTGLEPIAFLVLSHFLSSRPKAALILVLVVGTIRLVGTDANNARVQQQKPKYFAARSRGMVLLAARYVGTRPNPLCWDDPFPFQQGIEANRLRGS